MENKTFGKRIKYYRQLKGMSQDELGNKCGVNYRTISSWESNRTEPNLKNIEDLCKALEVTQKDLMVAPENTLFTALYDKNHPGIVYPPSSKEKTIYQKALNKIADDHAIQTYIDEILHSSEREHFIEYLEKMHQLITLKSELNIP